MDRNQQYLTNLLGKVPKWELTDPQQQDAFEKIRNSVTTALDLQTQLKALYKVSNFSEVALGLMWIANNVERDPSKLESTLDEETFVLNLLKKAFGQASSEPAPSGDSFGFDFPAPPSEEPQQAVPMGDVTPPALEQGSAASSAGGGGDEGTFSVTLEKLLEAVQSGSEERTSLLDELTTQAEGIVATADTDADFKTFCGYLMEFLKYVSVNQLFDDIRVMNLLSNIFDPFSQWVKTDPGSRSGYLDQPIETLRDFKALFE